jgi:hypothetical protein
MRLRSQVLKSSPAGCSSTTDAAETVTASAQGAGPSRDTWREIDCLGAAHGARTSCARAGE